MSDISQFDRSFPAYAPPLAQPAPFRIDEAYWGYIVKYQTASGLLMPLVQVVALFLGAALLAAALGLLLLPATFVFGQIDATRLGGVICCAVLAAVMLWCASRGHTPELQVDRKLGEIREMMRNRSGKTTLVRRIAFDRITAVTCDQGTKGQFRLVLEQDGQAKPVQIAAGDAGQMRILQARLGHDVTRFWKIKR